jgi:hypothetical protein
MKISIISVFPEFHQSINTLSIIGKAVQQGLVSFDFIRFSDLCEPKERIDEPICGPGAGMILKPIVVQKAIELAEQRWGKGFKVFFSPHGTVLTQPILRQYAAQFFANPAQINLEPVFKTLRDDASHPLRADGTTCSSSRQSKSISLNSGSIECRSGRGTPNPKSRSP